MVTGSEKGLAKKTAAKKEQKIEENKTEEKKEKTGKTKKEETSETTNIDNIISTIEKMTVMELAELSKSLQEKFGVSAAVPVAAGAAAPAEAEKAEEHFQYYAPLFEIGNEIDFVLSETRRIRNRYPAVCTAPMLYRVEDHRLYLIRE